MLRILNRRDSSTPKVIAGLVKGVCAVIYLDFDFFFKNRLLLVAGFSFGPRNCIGQRFALSETVCVLALLIRKWEVLVPASLEGKTMEEKKSRMLGWIPGPTIIPANAGVRLKERSR